MGNYGAIENVGGGPAVTANALAGTPVGGATANAQTGSPATMSTAPYKPPKKDHPQGDHRLCNKEGCRQWRKLESDFCRHHGP